MQKIWMARAHDGKFPPFKIETDNPTSTSSEECKALIEKQRTVPFSRKRKPNVNAPKQGNTGTLITSQNVNVKLFDANSGKFLENKKFQYSTPTQAKLVTSSGQGYKQIQDPGKCPKGGPGKTNSSSAIPVGPNPIFETTTSERPNNYPRKSPSGTILGKFGPLKPSHRYSRAQIEGSN